MIDPVKNLGKAHARIQEGMAAGERVLRLLDSHPTVELPAPAAAVQFEGLREAIELDGVWFSYAGERWVLRDVSLTIPRGAMVALVGPSGAGKSSLADMIPRFHDPVRGSVRMDGVDLRRIDTSSLRSAIGIVTQEPVLFNDTILSNMTCGNPGDFTRERVLEAARAANALEFIERLPLGFDTPVGERGAALSGGQKQRITIARAVLRNPEILVLDEATSSLDTESERLVQDAIHHLVENRTALVIAHRLSTVVRADVIHVLEAGSIVESGSHDELIAHGGIYRKLYEQQLADPAGGGAGGGEP